MGFLRSDEALSIQFEVYVIKWITCPVSSCLVLRPVVLRLIAIGLFPYGSNIFQLAGRVKYLCFGVQLRYTVQEFFSLVMMCHVQQERKGFLLSGLEQNNQVSKKSEDDTLGKLESQNKTSGHPKKSSGLVKACGQFFIPQVLLSPAVSIECDSDVGRSKNTFISLFVRPPFVFTHHVFVSFVQIPGRQQKQLFTMTFGWEQLINVCYIISSSYLAHPLPLLQYQHYVFVTKEKSSNFLEPFLMQQYKMLIEIHHGNLPIENL